MNLKELNLFYSGHGAESQCTAQSENLVENKDPINGGQCDTAAPFPAHLFRSCKVAQGMKQRACRLESLGVPVSP